MKYRPDIVILFEILKALSGEGATISKIMSKSNMPYSRVKEKLDHLIKMGLVEEYLDDNNRRYYRLTELGNKTMKKLREMIAFLSELGLIDLAETDR